MHPHMPHNRSLQRLTRQTSPQSRQQPTLLRRRLPEENHGRRNRKCWKIPVMEGNFIVEDGFGAMEAVAGGNFMIFAETQEAGLKAAEAAADAIRLNAPDVIMQFPGGVCRAGSKAGSLKYKLKASTNHPYCPTLRTLVPDTVVPEGVTCVYEIVMNGLTLDAVKNGMKQGVYCSSIRARCREDFVGQLRRQTRSVQSVPERSPAPTHNHFSFFAYGTFI